MKYVPPYTSVDPDAPYVNGNPGAGIEGSIPPAAAFEHPQREMLAVITAAGLTPDGGNLAQLLEALGKLYAPAKARYWTFNTPSGTIPASTDTRIANYANAASNMPASTVNKTAGTITIGADDAGVYVVGAGGAVTSATVVDIIAVCVNGTGVVFQSMQSPSDVTAQDPSCAGIIVLATGDVVDASYFQTRSGGGSNTLVNTATTRFYAARIGVL